MLRGPPRPLSLLGQGGTLLRSRSKASSLVGQGEWAGLVIPLGPSFPKFELWSALSCTRVSAQHTAPRHCPLTRF